MNQMGSRYSFSNLPSFCQRSGFRAAETFTRCEKLLACDTEPDHGAPSQAKQVGDTNDGGIRF